MKNRIALDGLAEKNTYYSADMAGEVVSCPAWIDGIEGVMHDRTGYSFRGEG
jgi:hypothetical protein